jgi:hypothetical protein
VLDYCLEDGFDGFVPFVFECKSAYQISQLTDIFFRYFPFMRILDSQFNFAFDNVDLKLSIAS